MVRRDAYESDAPSGPGGAFNLLRLVGHSKHLSSGFVGFAIKSFSVSAGASVVFGMASYMLFSKHIGPVMPFLGGAAFGFVGGLVHRYMNDLDEAQLMLTRYPKIMEYHVGQVEPSELRDVSFADWLRDQKSSLRKQGVLIAALYSAADTLSKLQEEEEERILTENYGAAAAAAAAEQ
ncbi:hypothetical protein VOLCADRAFT_107245 [Volvox carteri f. nagariensis]|uniref:Uncharacterized protein n=1 Tax=Volvox carteri f. nagariensis TaxID=3068 RepID=D8UCU2_VOLCA|nr:uncharacterized protein VOLCADRAFT_107245 [Volvox carteri f. nagariensis]EFJ42449.1 hypothetical protein VOLCADRAFT_107245 [Volvox carteri f. nagariensis]|eukprot:XP_002956512.1 hypothetical protein VOLCADRAFT_107245 [Volvox carteri f. nagariensis]